VTKTKKVLITGGPVHAHLDAVKIITNRFKGGLMAQLAERMFRFDAEITYLCAPSVGAKVPRTFDGLTIVEHSGLEDYRKKVLEFAPSMDSVILGAAVANLIPAKPYQGKFPSHNYNPGDVIPIDFTIAPRVIDEVKRVAPHTHLFGYKLLSGVTKKELIDAAYSIVLESKATAVFANDAENLQQKYAVTKERSVHPLSQGELAEWIWTMLNDEYYRTESLLDQPDPEPHVVERVKKLFMTMHISFLWLKPASFLGLSPCVIRTAS
jgi:phosphopantothenoylcysteine synthetase/decarboxylase